MAARSDSIPVDKVETLLCCSICLERLHDPRTLPCFHSYCKQCLEKFVAKLRKKAAKAGKKIEEFECPSCRSLFCLKENDEVANMGGSHFIRNMIEVLNAESGANVWKCSNHNEKASCCRCVTCKAFLCDGCFTAHDNWPAFKDHSVLTIEELKKPQNQSKIKDQMRCKEHKDKKLKFYCETCQVLICWYCMDFNHVRPGHVCHPIEKVAEKHRESLQSCCNILDEERKMGEKSLKVVADAEKMLKTTAENTKEEICKQKNDIIRAFEDIFQSKISAVEKLYAKFEEQLTGQRSKVESFLDKIKCAGDMCKNLLEKGSDEEIMESQKMMEERLETVKIESQNIENLPNPVLVDRNWFKAKQVMIGTLSTIFGEVTDNVFENSSILKQAKYDQQMIEWFVNEGWQLCYRATTDGWSAKDFHSECEMRDPTLTFVKVDDNIFGGYIGVDWKDINSCKTKEAFMFSIQNNDKLPSFKANEKIVTERQGSLVSHGKKQHDSKTAISAQPKTNQQVLKTGECREQPLPNREQQSQINRHFSKSDFGDSKVEKRREPETGRDNRQKQDSKFHDKRDHPREEAKRTSNENKKSTKPCDDLPSTKRQADRFNVGYMSPRADRRPYSDSRRGAPSSRRGARGGARGMRGRGRGRPVASGRHVGKGRVASKDDDENDFENFHSADSSSTSESDESDVEDVFQENYRQKDDRRFTRSYSSGGRTKQSYSSCGRGRGNSQLPRSSRKLPERPPRFYRQDQARS